MTIPVTSIMVEIKGEETTAGSRSIFLKRKGSIDPTRTPTRTTICTEIAIAAPK